MNQTKDSAEGYKAKYEKLKHKDDGAAEDYMDQARAFSHKLGENRSEDHDGNMYGHIKSATNGRSGSVASLSSGLAMHAKTIVNSMKDFNCNAVNERNGPMVASEMSGSPGMRYEGRDRRPRTGGTNSSKAYSRSPQRHTGGGGSSNRPRSSSRNKSSRSFREYSRSPQRVDV